VYLLSHINYSAAKTPSFYLWDRYPRRGSFHVGIIRRGISILRPNERDKKWNRKMTGK